MIAVVDGGFVDGTVVSVLMVPITCYVRYMYKLKTLQTRWFNLLFATASVGYATLI